MAEAAIIARMKKKAAEEASSSLPRSETLLEMKFQKYQVCATLEGRGVYLFAIEHARSVGSRCQLEWPEIMDRYVASSWKHAALLHDGSALICTCHRPAAWATHCLKQIGAPTLM